MKGWFSLSVLSASLLLVLTSAIRAQVKFSEQWKSSGTTDFFSLAWSSGGHQIAAYSSYANKISVMDTTGRVVSEVFRRGDHYSGDALTFIGERWIVSRPESYSDSESVYSVFDVQSGRLVYSAPSNLSSNNRQVNWARLIASSPAMPNEFAVVYGDTNKPIVEIYLPESWSLKKRFEADYVSSVLGSAVTGIAFSTDGKWLVLSGTRTVALFRTEDFGLSHVLTVHGPETRDCCIGSVSFGNSSKTVIITSYSFKRSNCSDACEDKDRCCETTLPTENLALIDVDKNSRVHFIPTDGEPVWSATMKPDGETLVFATSTRLCVWEPPPRTMSCKSNSVQAVRFSPTAQSIALASNIGMNVLSVTK